MTRKAQGLLLLAMIALFVVPFGSATAQVQDQRFVPIGSMAPTPAIFDTSAQANPGYNWSAVFNVDTPVSPANDQQPAVLTWTHDVVEQLTEINLRLNRTRFTAGGTRAGCSDFVLIKQAALLEAGVPAELLSPAIVRTHGGKVHSVLILTTTDGDYVMDNLSPYILRWDSLAYEWIKRQVSVNPATGERAWAWIAQPDRAKVRQVASRAVWLW